MKAYHSIIASKSSSYRTFFATTQEKALQIALSHARKGQKVYVITDKQFGLSVNSWNKEVPKTNVLTDVLLNGNGFTTAFPMTKKQIANAVKK